MLDGTGHLGLDHAARRNSRGIVGGFARRIAQTGCDVIVRSPGPAGPLEALLDEPPGRGVTEGLSRGRRRPRARRLRASASAVRRDDAHEGGVSGGEGARRASAAPCSASIFAASGASEGTFDDGRGEMDDFRAALDFMRERYPGRRRSGRPACRSASWIALTVGARTIRACRR